MDMQLPGTDGLSLVEEIRRNPAWPTCRSSPSPPTPCAATASGFIAGGCDGYIAKPINVASFVDEVQSALQAARARRPGGGTSVTTAAALGTGRLGPGRRRPAREPGPRRGGALRRGLPRAPRRRRRGGAGGGGGRAPRLRRPGRDDAAPGRFRGLRASQAAARHPLRADPHAHGPVRGRGQGAGLRAGGRRLPQQAGQHPRAGRRASARWCASSACATSWTPRRASSSPWCRRWRARTR